MQLTILYFANLADSLGLQTEQLVLEDVESLSVAELKEHLAKRGDNWQTLLHAPSTRCAVSQTMANDTSIIQGHTEVAFFPPVTGG